MLLTPKTVETLETELLSDDPFAWKIADKYLSMAIPDAFLGTLYFTVAEYNEYLITCFLLLLEAHDSCQ